jgi:protocatechuate 3,4-dioxygenase beta subunit
MFDAMGSDFSEQSATDAVVDSFSGTPDPRLRQILDSFTRHLHAFVRDVEPTQREWEQAIDFLTRTGQRCDDTRQEFILLSDVMGVSMLVDAINNRKPAGVTESTVLGPFHVVESPALELGADIAGHSDSPRCLVRGRVLDLSGTPVPGARVDVWQADDEGFYDVQKPGSGRDLRGLFTTDASGAYRFTTIVPKYYPIPDDGPVGELLRTTGRHPYRPAHIHLIADAPGCRPVITHLFIGGSPYLDDDTVFGVKQSLVRTVQTVDGEPGQLIEFDITLGPAQ